MQPYRRYRPNDTPGSATRLRLGQLVVEPGFLLRTHEGTVLHISNGVDIYGNWSDADKVEAVDCTHSLWIRDLYC
jgi:hypothetical protein